MTIVGGRAERNGGGVRVLGDNAQFVGCTVANNETNGEWDYPERFENGEWNYPENYENSESWTNGFASPAFDAFNNADGGGFYVEADNVELLSCVITNNVSNANGGGVCITGNNAKINNCSITDNSTRGFPGSGYIVTSGYANGGGVYISGDAATIIDSDVSYNAAFGAGGGVYAVGSDVVIDNSSINGNTSVDGGGVCALGAQPTILDSTISNNTTGGSYVCENIWGGGWNNPGGYGGGVFILETAVGATITNSEISYNTGSIGGGVQSRANGVQISSCRIFDNSVSLEDEETEGGGVSVSGSNIAITDCVITHNIADVGGGINVCWGSNATIAGCLVDNNFADDGGGIAVDFSENVTITNSRILHNNAIIGGGIYLVDYASDSFFECELVNCVIAGNAATVVSFETFVINYETFEVHHGGDGGGLYAVVENSSSISLTNCTITNNDGYDGAGIYYDSINSDETANLNVANSIIAANAGNDATVKDADSIINAYNTLSSFVDWTNAADATNYLYDPSKPLFTDVANGDYTLASDSQALNKGDNSFVSVATDLAGNARVFIDVVDLGAYERNGWTLSAPIFGSIDTTATTITPAWGKVPYATRYYLAYALGDGAFTTINVGNYSVKTITGLTEGETYRIKVRAISDNDALDNSPWSDVWIVTTSAPETPSLVVTTLDDVVDAYDNQISLREALLYSAVGDTITFASSLNNGTIFLNGSLLSVDKSVLIDASDLDSLTIDANRQSTVFHLRADNSQLKGLTITGGNKANGDGGGIWVVAGHASLINCAIVDNEASSHGGGICLTDYATNFSMINCTVAGNRAPYGGGIYRYSSSDFQPEIYNSIIATNDGGDIALGNADSVIGAYNTLSTYADWDAGANNYVYDPALPLFTDASNGDYTLAPGSQAINKGNAEYVSVETDLNGDPRVVNGQVDLGAYEYQGEIETQLPNDSSTTFLLRFDGALTDVNGIEPTNTPTVGYELGMVCQAVQAGTGSITYNANEVANASEGTIEFWYKPNFDRVGNYATQHWTFVELGNPFNNGIVIQIDSANNFRALYWGDKIATQNVTETNYEDGIGVSASSWEAGEWRHIATTWNQNGDLALYVNGVLIGKRVGVLRLGNLATNAKLTISRAADPANGAFDEFRVSDRARTPREILLDYLLAKGEAAPDLIQLPAPTLRTTARSTDFVAVSWDAVENASEYELLYKNQSSANYASVRLNANATSYTIQGLEEGATYNVKIRALGDGVLYESSADSAILSARTLKTLDAPTITSTSASTSSISVSWSAVANASSYVVAYAPTGGLNYSTISTTAKSATITGLTSGTTYVVKVLAKGDSYNYLDSAYGESASVKVKTQLAAPSVSSTVSQSSSASISWNSIPNASSYTIAYAVNGSSNYTEKTVSSNSHTITGLSPLTTYLVKVRANGDGANYVTSAYGGNVSFKTLEDPSLVVNSLNDNVSGVDGKITLREALTVYATSGATITFDSSLAGGRIVLSGSQIQLTQSVTIDASALSSLMINGNNLSRVFQLTSSGQTYTIKGITFENGNGSNGHGGAINVGTGATLVAQDCVFTNNRSSDNQGGAVYASGTANFTNCVFKNNEANGGGAVSVQNGTLNMNNCELQRNTASNRGGAIAVFQSSTATFRNTTIADNTATNKGGGVFAYTSTSTATFYNSIIARNTSTSGGDSVAEFGSGTGAKIQGYYTLSPFTAWTTSTSNYTYDTSKRLSNDADNGDYRLASTSQAIDKGKNSYVSGSTDLRGKTRIVNGVVDLGAYERQTNSAATLDFDAELFEEFDESLDLIAESLLD